jgi:hypothetical protein
MDELVGGLEVGGTTWVARAEKLQAPTRNKIAMKKTIIFLRFMAFSPFQQHGCRPSVRIWIVRALVSFIN